ncbi:MAG: hypothetical protein K6L60_12820 [Oceanobacter sp.]
MFRILSILQLLDSKKVEIDRLKIMDFYFVFPHLLTTSSLPRIKGSAEVKREAQKLDTPYENLPATKILFSEMGDFQLQALDILRSKGIVDFDETGWLTLGECFSEDSIHSLVSDNRFTSKKFFRILVSVLAQCKLHGLNGLKDRTGLMEYRYDAI